MSIRYEMLVRENRITVIDDDKYDTIYSIGNNDRINNQVMEAHALSRQQQEKWAVSARQLDRKTQDIVAVQQNIHKNGLKNKAYFDKNHYKRVDKIEVGDMVLLYNSSLDKQWSQKLNNRWLGPYRIWEIAEDRSICLLDKLDSIQLDGIFVGDHIKKFHCKYSIESAEDGEDADDAKDDVSARGEDDKDNIEDANDTSAEEDMEDND